MSANRRMRLALTLTLLIFGAALAVSLTIGGERGTDAAVLASVVIVGSAALLIYIRPR